VVKVAIIRCEKNQDLCPLTNCFKCLFEKREGFAQYEETQLLGLFTCRCPGDSVTDLADILKKRGADAIHFCTCTFAKKSSNGWDMSDGGFCKDIDKIIERIHNETGVRCVKGTAHLPKGYNPEVWL